MLYQRKCFQGLSNYKLSTLVEYLKIPVSHFHRAEQDAWACGRVFHLILKKIDIGMQKTEYLDCNKLNQITGKKELRFPPLKAHQLSLFD